MSWAKDLESIAATCVAISNKAANSSGFVPISKLLGRFGIEIYVRPLLVEGMLIALPHTDSSRARLAVLIDSETSGVTLKEIGTEDEGNPLPTRVRATVAHELLHSLAFRPGEVGLRLEHPVDSDEAVGELVKAIEADVERLTPLLLWPEDALDRLLATRSKAVTPGELANIAKTLGISRQVAITRLRLRRANGGIVNVPWLADVAVGIGEWVSEQRAIFHKWPLLANFDRSFIPSFLHDVASQDRLPTTGIFDERFVLEGGDHTTTTFLTSASLKDSRSVEKMQVVVSVENVVRKSGAEFLYVVRKKRADDTPAVEPAYAEKRA